MNIRICIGTLAIVGTLLAAPPVAASYENPQISVRLTFTKLVVGKTVLLSPRNVRSDINAAVDLFSASKTVCRVFGDREGFHITGLKVGSCKLQDYMPGMKGKFPSASKTVIVPVVAK